MIIILCAWLVCLAVLYVMVKRAPVVEDDPDDKHLPDDPSKPSEYRARPVI